MHNLKITVPSTEQEWAPPRYCVVVPTFEERDNVQPLFAKLQAVMPDRGWEVIFVDDDSRDGTPEAIYQLMDQHFNVRLIRRFGRRGLSSAAVEGMMATAAPIVAVMDADMQHDEEVLPKLLQCVDDGADVALGTRYAQNGSLGSWAQSRALISRFATVVAGRANKNPVTDPMSGFLAVRRDLVVELMPRLSLIGFKILLDILMSSPGKLKVSEVPYHFRCRTAGESKLDVNVSIDFLLLLLEKKTGRFIPARLFLFAAVGGSGLLVHLLLLRLMLSFGLSFVVAQSVAVAVAIASNFSLNNVLTYRDRQLRGWRMIGGLLSFYAVCGIGAIANVGVASFLYFGNERWWVAGIAGAVIGAVWNYVASSFFTWRRK